VDKTYPSGFAESRPILTPRSHCAVETEDYDEWQEATRSAKGRCALFNMQLRAGHGYRNQGEE
jgi:hypothetical protein